MMKSLLSTLFIGLTAMAFSQANSYPNGSTVADFTVTDTHGETHNLYDITASGKHVFLDFFFVDCPPCQSTQAYYNELHDKYGCNDGDLYVISINNGNDNNAQVDAFESTYGGTFNHAPAVSNEGGGAAVDGTFGIAQYPTYVLIGPDNKMISNDIWPISNVGSFEAEFPSGFNPAVQACTFASTPENTDIMSGLSVFPNPANAELNISFDAVVSSTATIEITNLLGQVVYTQNIETTVGTNQNTIAVNGLAQGNYIAKIMMNDQIATVKFNKK